MSVYKISEEFGHTIITTIDEMGRLEDSILMTKKSLETGFYSRKLNVTNYDKYKNDKVVENSTCKNK